MPHCQGCSHSGYGCKPPAPGGISTDGAAGHRNPVLIAIAWAIYAVVLTVIIIGVLYIARDFIAHHTGYHFLGAKPT